MATKIRYVVGVDINEISNSIKKTKKRRYKPLLPLLFDPVDDGLEKDLITGKTYKKYRLMNLERAGISYRVEQLDFGDYHLILEIDGVITVIIIERKTVGDFIKSMTGTTNRLVDQLKKMSEEAPKYFDNYVIVLLIEDFYGNAYVFDDEINDQLVKGVWTINKMIPTKKKEHVDKNGRPRFATLLASRNSYIHPGSFLSMVEKIEKHGVEVWKFWNAFHAYDVIIKMISLQGKEKTSYVRSIRRKPAKMTLEKSVRFILEGLPRIGGGTSTKIINKKEGDDGFVLIDWLNKVAGASSHVDLGIDGLGPVTFKDIKSILTSPLFIDDGKDGGK
jgi:ERCC4-type nuclease